MTAYSQTLTDSMGVADRHTWSEMIFSWDTYTGTWDSYGEIPIQRIWTSGRVFEETLSLTQVFSRIATIGRTFTEAISLTETIIRNPIKRFSESISHSEVFSRISTSIRTLAEALTLTDSVMHHLAKNFSDAITHIEMVIKKPVKRISETLAMTEIFSKINAYSRTFTETLNVTEQDYTWDIMTSTWDDYTESWSYYSPALQIIKILVRPLYEALDLADSIFSRVGHFLKNAFGKIGEASLFGSIKKQDSIGKISGEMLFGRVNGEKLGGKTKEEKFIGKITIN